MEWDRNEINMDLGAARELHKYMSYTPVETTVGILQFLVIQRRPTLVSVGDDQIIRLATGNWIYNGKTCKRNFLRRNAHETQRCASGISRHDLEIPASCARVGGRMFLANWRK